MRQNLRRGVWDVGCGQHAAQGCPARKRDYRLPDGWVHPFLMYGYQSLQAWKRADAAVEVVLRALETKNHPKTFAIFDQIRRATISVAANIVEGMRWGRCRYTGSICESRLDRPRKLNTFCESAGG